jgi:hypothetical protein
VDVPVDAFVRDVQQRNLAVDEVPQLLRAKVLLGIAIGRVRRESGHSNMSPGFLLKHLVKSTLGASCVFVK